jgi:hypothetical protein
MKEDQISEIGGLPQRLGTTKSIITAVVLALLAIAVIFYL